MVLYDYADVLISTGARIYKNTTAINRNKSSTMDSQAYTGIVLQETFEYGYESTWIFKRDTNDMRLGDLDKYSKAECHNLL